METNGNLNQAIKWFFYHHASRNIKTQRQAGWDGDSVGWVSQRSQCCKDASWQSSNKPRSGKRYPNRFRRLYETLLPDNMERHCREWPTGNRLREKASHSIKQQPVEHHSLHWWLSHNRPVRVGLHCQARCNHHRRRQCGLYGLLIKLDNGRRCSHHALCWIASRGDSQTTHTAISTDSVSLLKKRFKWKAEAGMCQCSSSTIGNTCLVGVISWTCRSQETRDTEGKQMIWRTFKLIRGFYDLETVCSLFKLNESAGSETTPFQGV